MRLKLFLIVIFSLFALAACSSSQPPASGNYSCTAANNAGETWKEVAYNRRDARAMAMRDCQTSGGGHPHSCRITRCTWQGKNPAPPPPSDSATCIIKNTLVNGEWSVTAATAQEATQQALARCHHYSGYPRTCYFVRCESRF